MAMTAMVKDELSRVECTKTSERKAEVASMLRFAGGLHIVSGRIVVEAELDTGAAARRCTGLRGRCAVTGPGRVAHGDHRCTDRLTGGREHR